MDIIVKRLKLSRKTNKLLVTIYTKFYKQCCVLFSQIALDSSTGHLSSGGGSQGTVGVGEGGQEGGSSLPCTVMAVCDYEAAKEDHISVKAGDTIQVYASYSKV